MHCLALFVFTGLANNKCNMTASPSNVLHEHEKHHDDDHHRHLNEEGDAAALCVDGMYPLYEDSAVAVQASPMCQSHAHFLNGKTYFMPNGLAADSHDGCPDDGVSTSGLSAAAVSGIALGSTVAFVALFFCVRAMPTPTTLQRALRSQI